MEDVSFILLIFLLIIKKRTIVKTWVLEFNENKTIFVVFFQKVIYFLIHEDYNLINWFIIYFIVKTRTPNNKCQRYSNLRLVFVIYKVCYPFSLKKKGKAKPKAVYTLCSDTEYMYYLQKCSEKNSYIIS